MHYPPPSGKQTFLVSDGQDLSTTELVRGMAQAAGVPARLLPVPVWALQAGASLLGKGDAVQRLCGNLQVDMSKARNLLGWLPPVTVEERLTTAMAICVASSKPIYQKLCVIGAPLRFGQVCLAKAGARRTQLSLCNE